MKMQLLTANITVALSLLLCCPSVCFGLDSVAEAYLMQGKRDFDRGDYRSAKRLFNKAAFDADQTFQNKLYVAVIYHNAGEAYQKLVEVNPDYSDIDDDVLAQEFLQSKLQSFEAGLGDAPKVVTADQTAVKFQNNRLTDRRSYSDDSHISTQERNQWIAIHYFRLALQLKEKMLGANSEEVAKSMDGLALVYEEFNTRLEEAEALAQKALSIREKLSGPASNDVAISLYTLAKVLKTSASSHDDGGAKSAMQKDAIGALNRSLAILRANKLGKSHLAAMDCSLLSLLQMNQKNFAAAIEAFNSGFDILSVDASHKSEFLAYKVSHAQIADMAMGQAISELRNLDGKTDAQKVAALKKAKSSAYRSGNVDRAQELADKIKAFSGG